MPIMLPHLLGVAPVLPLPPRRCVCTPKTLSLCPLKHSAVGSLEWAGGDGSPLPLYPPRKLSHLNIAANGWCADPVDYSAWQLLFHMLCPRQAGE